MSTEHVPGELSQAEKRATLENDRRVRQQQQATTLSQFAQSSADEDRGGRYAAVNQTIHTATAPVYPEQPSDSPFHHDPVPDEPALGVDINAMEPVGTPAEVQASIDKLAADTKPEDAVA